MLPVGCRVVVECVLARPPADDTFEGDAMQGAAPGAVQARERLQLWRMIYAELPFVCWGW